MRINPHGFGIAVLPVCALSLAVSVSAAGFDARGGPLDARTAQPEGPASDYGAKVAPATGASEAESGTGDSAAHPRCPHGAKPSPFRLTSDWAPWRCDRNLGSPGSRIMRYRARRTHT